MRSKTAFRLVLAVALGTFVFARPAAAAEGSPMDSIAASGGKLLLEKGAQWMAGYIYKNDCKGANHDVASLVCGALGQFSGEKEKEWKANITAELAAIRGDLALLQQGQLVMQTQLNTIVQQNNVLHAKIATIADQTVAQSNIRTIQTLWNQYFVPLFADATSFRRDQILKFAQAVINEHHLNIKLGKLTETLTVSGAGNNPPLLRSYAGVLNAQLPANELRASLLPSYEYFEGVMSSLLFEQRKGFLMYAWAAEILESECQLRTCTTAERPPLSAAAYTKTFNVEVARQLEAFNSSLEWLVLARSDVHGPDANFLHADAAEVFYRADLLAAANADSYGLWGRVVAMGDRWDGKLDISGRTLTPASQAEVPVEGGPVDWWRASATPLVYDELSFASSWRIFRYRQADAKLGPYEIRTTLPGKPPLGVNVTPVNLDLNPREVVKELVVPFGSFLAVERAGGGYALLSGTWQEYKPHEGAGSGLLKPSHNVLVADAKQWRVGVENRGELLFDTKKQAGARQYGEWEKVAALISNKQIRYPAGGNVTLNARFGTQGFTGDSTKGSTTYDASYANRDSMLGMWTDYETGGINPKAAELKARVAFVFGDRDSANGLVYQENRTFNSPGAWHLDRAVRETGSATARLDRGHSYPLTLVAYTKVYQEPKGLHTTHYSLLARAQLLSLYVTPANN